MKIREFVSTLRSNKAVTFQEGNRLEARPDSLAAMLADSLERVLRADADVHGGWQVSELPDSWRGQQEWWLIVGDELVRIQATASSQEPRNAEIALRIFPLHHAAPTVKFSYHEHVDERGAREMLLSMQLEMLIEGETFNPAGASGGALDAFVGFIGHVRGAIVRARAKRALKGET